MSRAEFATRVAARSLWLGAVPVLLALGATRWLIPDRWESGVAPPTLPYAVGFFLAFSLLLRGWRDRLPLGRHLVALPSTGGARATVLTILVAAAAALALRTVLGQPYRVLSGSMLPTLEPGDEVLVAKAAYGLRLPGVARPPSRLPGRGDIVVFRAGVLTGPGAEDDGLVKRVLGLPGDRITMRGGLAAINGWEVPTCDAGKYLFLAAGRTVEGRLLVEFLEDRAYLTVHTADARAFAGYQVQPGEVFVLGDNRNDSRDSRSGNEGRGAGVPLGALAGRAWRLTGHDRDGRIDPARLLQRPDLHLHLRGMDARALAAGITRCLAQRPPVTTPPPP